MIHVQCIRIHKDPPLILSLVRSMRTRGGTGSLHIIGKLPRRALSSNSQGEGVSCSAGNGFFFKVFEVALLHTFTLSNKPASPFQPHYMVGAGRGATNRKPHAPRESTFNKPGPPPTSSKEVCQPRRSRSTGLNAIASSHASTKAFKSIVVSSFL